jgi:hypothetical protein
MNLRTLIHRNVFKKSIPIYYGIGFKHLDIQTLQYKMFAAVWENMNGYRYIIGYWFGDNKDI